MSSVPVPEAMQPIDIARERGQCSFSIDTMTIVFAGTKTARDRSRWLMSLLENHPDDIFNKNQRPFQGRMERFMQGQIIALEYFKLRNRYGLPKEDRDQLRLYLDEYITLQVSESMGLPTVQNQGSKEQWKEWGSKISSGQWLLCYAQTEMAHGSNLGGLMTTATLCKDTDEWDVHTPTMSASKIWIGGSGSTATHAILMAKMIIDGKDLGMHPFLMPLRDPATHQLLPGRQAIDMGPKKGAASMDNGFLTFTHAKIPRTNVMARFQTVDKDGKYEMRNKSGKILIRGAMTLVRVGLCEIAAHHAARASLIAIRYAAVRRQGSSKNRSGMEPQIIDYASVQQRLFTAMASSYALTFAARRMRSIYNELQTELQEKGNSPLLSIVHGYTSVLKAVMTNESYNVIWRCRKSMGGHGYSAASGLTDLENSQPDANLTYEGDNNMLLSGPAANFLVKELQAVLKSGQPSRPELAYLSQQPRSGKALQVDLSTSRPLGDAKLQLDIVGHRACRLVYSLHHLRSSSQGKDQNLTAHLDARLAARASKAHGSYFILYSFTATIESLRKSKGNGTGVVVGEELFKVLERVRSLYALETCILDDLGDYTEDGYLNTQVVEEAQKESARLMADIRPDVIGLVEAADMNDWYLASPLGSSDGRAYERMLEFMKREPINQMGEAGARDQDGVLKGFRNVLGTLTHGEVEGWNEKESAKREEERGIERRAKL
jgi:acyl-CoA oxidase